MLLTIYKKHEEYVRRYVDDIQWVIYNWGLSLSLWLNSNIKEG